MSVSRVLLATVALSACRRHSTPSQEGPQTQHVPRDSAVVADAPSAPDAAGDEGGDSERGDTGCDLPDVVRVQIGGATHSVSVLFCREGKEGEDTRRFAKLVLWSPDATLLDDPIVEMMLERWTESPDNLRNHSTPAVLKAVSGDDAIVVLRGFSDHGVTGDVARVMVVDGSAFRTVYEVERAGIDVEAVTGGARVELCTDEATRCDDGGGTTVRELWRWSGSKLLRQRVP